MFWQANRWGVIALAIGLSVVGALYFILRLQDEALADRVLSTGVCLVLFIVGLATFLSTKKGAGDD